jgi:hypothetical protein
VNEKYNPGILPISELFHCMFSQSNLSSSSLPVGGSITLKAFRCSFTSIPLVRTWNLRADEHQVFRNVRANFKPISFDKS